MDIYEKLSKIVKKFIKGKEITPESKLKELGLDSLDIADILAAIEEEFGFEFEDEEMYSISTVEDLKNLIEKKM